MLVILLSLTSPSWLPDALLLKTAVAPSVFTNQGRRLTRVSLRGQNPDHVPLSDGCDVDFTAVNKVRTWALDREVFQNIMRRTAETRHEQYRNFLRRLGLAVADEHHLLLTFRILIDTFLEDMVEMWFITMVKLNGRAQTPDSWQNSTEKLKIH